MNSVFKQKHEKLRIGFLLNPYAGLGGPRALKGSDALAASVDPANEMKSRSATRALTFFNQLTERNIECVLDKGVMGLASLASCDEQSAKPWTAFCTFIDGAFPATTSAENSIELCRHLLQQEVDLIVFVGGDGTARDVCRAVGLSIPVLGVPAGVKMHSGVFANSPSAAANVIDAVSRGELVSVGEEEVRDIDEQAFQQGVVRSKHFGEMLVPQELRYIQHVKQGGVEQDELVLLDIANEIEERIQQEPSDTLYIFAPGSTTHFILESLQCESTLLGVDVYDGHAILTKDTNADELTQLSAQHEGKIVLILTAIGGQGHIIGRGNQQLSPELLKRIGRDNLWVVATKKKLLALNSRPLLMDSGDAELDEQWQGLVPVITGYRDAVLYRVGLE